ncbi:zinc-ribbon domain-containing protein [Ruminococcus sp.]|uniref:zinc-ribbon domain-containing protein n=1 Tax=Ruminococcus sp. TaxID=41978 RepID=UPI00386BC7E2
MAFCSNCGNKLTDGAKFCYKCGSPCQTVQENSSERKTVFQGVIYKCPNCGEQLKSFDLNCPACGFEIRGISATNSVKEFAKKLEDIESHREYEKPKRFMTTSLLERISKTDEQKISLIRSFSVPNTIEDMLEFMILASTNIDYSLYSKTDSSHDKSRIAVANAWLSKAEQVYIKAQSSYGANENFGRIQEIYFNCKEEIKKRKKSKTIKWALLIGCIPLLFIISLIISQVTYPAAKEKEETRLQGLMTEAESYLSTNDYQQALRRAEALEYKLSNDDEEERWNIIREDLIDEIIEKAHSAGVELERPTEPEPTSYLDHFRK